MTKDSEKRFCLFLKIASSRKTFLLFVRLIYMVSRNLKTIGGMFMAYCAKCGTEMPATNICSCGFVLPGTQPIQPPPQPQPEVIYVQAPPNPIFDIFLLTIKKLFSTKPQEAVSAASNSNTHVWALLAALNIVIVGFSVMAIPTGIIKSSLGMFGGFMSSAINEILPFGMLFGCGIAVAAISFFLMSGSIRILFAAHKLDVTFLQVLNLAAASYLISSVAAVAAILFSLFFAQLSILLVVIGAIGGVIMLYVGIQKTASFTSSPVWS